MTELVRRCPRARERPAVVRSPEGLTTERRRHRRAPSQTDARGARASIDVSDRDRYVSRVCAFEPSIRPRLQVAGAAPATCSAGLASSSSRTSAQAEMLPQRPARPRTECCHDPRAAAAERRRAPRRRVRLQRRPATGGRGEPRAQRGRRDAEADGRPQLPRVKRCDATNRSETLPARTNRRRAERRRPSRASRRRPWQSSLQVRLQDPRKMPRERRLRSAPRSRPPASRLLQPRPPPMAPAPTRDRADPLRPSADARQRGSALSRAAGRSPRRRAGRPGWEPGCGDVRAAAVPLRHGVRAARARPPGRRASSDGLAPLSGENKHLLSPGPVTSCSTETTAPRRLLCRRSGVNRPKEPGGRRICTSCRTMPAGRSRPWL